MTAHWRPRKTHLAFAGLSVFFLGTTLLWLWLNQSPPSWDDAYYLTRSLEMYDVLAECGLVGYARQSLAIMKTKPPLIALLPTPVYLVAGRRSCAAYAVNLVFLLAMFAALYRMGERYSSPRAGLLAVYIAGTMPILYGLARWFLVECGLTALVCGSICLLAEGDDLAGAWKGLFLGVTCGLGLLMKASFPLYVMIPLLYVAVRQRRTLLRWKPLLSFSASATALALPWYFVNFLLAVKTALRAGSAETAKVYRTGDVFSLNDIWNYLGNLLNTGPLLYFVLLTLLLLAFARRLPPAGKRGLLLCTFWGSPILFLMFGHYRDLRYAAPLFPAVALAIAILGDAALSKRAVASGTVAGILLVLPLFSMLHTSFGIFGNRRLELGGLLLKAPMLYWAHKYDRQSWPQQELLSEVSRRTKFTGRERKSVILGTDSVRFNVNNFELAAVEKRLPFQIATTSYDTDLPTLLSTLDSTEYFIYKEGGERDEPSFNTLGEAALKEVRQGGRFVELPIARKLPDGGIAHVYTNLWLNRFIQTGTFLRAGIETIPKCNVTFTGKLQLTGLSIQRTLEGLEVKYRWLCLRPVDRDYWCFTHIVDPRGNVAGYLDHPILNGEPSTTMWKGGDVAIEKLLFRSPELQSGESYHLRLGLFDRDSGERLPITKSDFPLTDNQTAAIVHESR